MILKGSSLIGIMLISKIIGCRFKSYLPCLFTIKKNNIKILIKMYFQLFFVLILQAAKLIGDGLQLVAGAGIGIGTVFGALIIGVSRNPSLKNELFKIAILGFAFCEAMALFTLMMSFLILFT